MDLDKSFKNAKWFAVGLLVLVLIVFISMLAQKEYTTSTLLIYIGMVVSLIGTIVGCNNQTMVGPISGIVLSVLLIVFGSVIEKIFGVLFLIDCIKLIKGLNS